MPKLAPFKEVAVKKEGYQSISQIKETDDSWIFQLYNPVEEKAVEVVDQEGEG